MRRRKGFLSRRKFMILGSLAGIGLIALIINLIVSILTAKEADMVEFDSADGLKISADIYLVPDWSRSPFIIMFHQANWSRGEFRSIAPRFNQEGYNCLAVDLRSGKKVKGVENLTAERAEKLGKQVRFVDAMQDMVATINYVEQKYNPPKTVIFGSSYSAGLALKIAGDYPDLVDGVIAFSPGEYFVKEGMSHTWILNSTKEIKVPVFIASAKKEKHHWVNLFDAIDSSAKLSYTPETPGKHGARALWQEFPESEGYWTMLDTFLKSYF